jgi:2,4-dienoyl-CoA reductase-like NADH-dependent reductase (Old Yellow Enzyme family)
LGVDLPFDDTVQSGPESPLAQSYQVGNRTIGNRFAVLPMEGWDGTPDGLPSDLTERRWQHFGQSGAKLIWGGEAVAVRYDGRANPNQLLLNPDTLGAIGNLRQLLVDAHQHTYGRTDDLMVGLQLTHSGRFARPNNKAKLEPQILYKHPFLNAKFNLPADYAVMTDAEIETLIGEFVTAAVRAQSLGYDFVDIKHCHGYLGHEFLTAVDRPGKYGGSFENRTRFLRWCTPERF